METETKACDSAKLDAALTLIWEVRRDRWNECGMSLDSIADDLAREIAYLRVVER